MTHEVARSYSSAYLLFPARGPGARDCLALMRVVPHVRGAERGIGALSS